MYRIIVAIILGILVVNSIAISGISSQIILPFVAYFIGGFIAGFVAQKHGLICGVIISVVSFSVLLFFLIYIAYGVSGGSIFFPKIEYLYPQLLSVIFGIIGGYLGERVYKSTTLRKRGRNV